MSADTQGRHFSAADLKKLLLDHADELLASLLFVVILARSFYRLRFGIDFTDEAFYAAITQRYALGDIPYVDEYNLRQTASLLTTPFYWLYLKVNGSTDGVIYFCRILYFALQCAVARAVYRFAAARIPRSLALIAATLPIVFLPFQIPTCSYNTLGSLLFAGGAFVALRALLDDPRPRTFLAAGVVHGLACVAYPPVALAVTLVAVMIPVTWGFGKPKDGRLSAQAVFFEYALGVAIVGVALLVVLIPGLKRHGVSDALSYEAMTTTVRSSEKAKEVIKAVLALVPGGQSGTFASLGVIALIGKHYPHLRKWVFAGLLAYFAYYFQDVQAAYPRGGNSLYLSIYLGLLGGIFLLFVDWKRAGKALVLVGWLPSVLAGFVSGFATANGGALNGGLGLFAAAALALVAAPLGVDASSFPRLTRVGAVIVLALIPLGTLSVNMEETYRSGPIATNTAVAKIGPYKWIRSDPGKVKQAEDLTRAMRAVLVPGERMLSYYDFPAPYLVAPIRPAMPTVWTDSRAKLKRLLPYYAAHRTGQGIVLVVSGMNNFCPELQTLTIDESRLLTDGGWFKLYREPPPP